MSDWLRRSVIPEGMRLPELTLPRRYLEATVEGITSAALQKTVRRYGKDFWEQAPRGIAPLFVGAAQTYKTYASAVLAQAIRERFRVPVGWCNCAAELVQFDRLAFKPETSERIEYLKQVPWLVMDDFTQASRSPRQLEILVEIGTTRFDNLLPTLWTGNIVLTRGNTDPLTQAVGTCLARRILEGSVGYRASTGAKPSRE